MIVEVYRNLHKKCYSIRHKGRVLYHAKSIVMRDCEFRVQEGGRKRVLREKKKNVHAGVSGYAVDSIPEDNIYSEAHLTYNPYKYNGFVAINDPYEIVTWSDYAHMECKDGTTSVWAVWWDLLRKMG